MTGESQDGLVISNRQGFTKRKNAEWVQNIKLILRR